MLPETKTPGAKAARTGAFMASWSPTRTSEGQQVFREGMRRLDEASQKANSVGFMAATPQQRLALLGAARPRAEDLHRRSRRGAAGGRPER